MELKTPTKKGIKTPRSRPPLPMLNESFSGYCVDEYDWPLFTGYYNGTSVIVDDSQAMTLLTNKGFFGKGSLSKGCPNVAKRKIPINVVFESQWKRRKMWIESLINILHESRKKCNETFEGNVKADKKEDNDAEEMDIDNEKNDSLQNDSCKTEQNSCKKRENDNKENSQNKSNQTSKDNMADIDYKKGNIVEIIEVDDEKNNSIIIEEETSVKSELIDNGDSKDKSVLTSKDNTIDIDNKSCDLEKMVVDNEKNNSQNICQIDEEPSNTCQNKENGDSKDKSVLTSKDNTIDIDNKSCDLEKMVINNEKNNLQNICQIDEEPSTTSQNKENGDSKVSTDTKQIIKEPEGCTCESDKNDEITSNPDENIQDVNKLIKDNVRIDDDDNNKMEEDSTSVEVVDDQSKCIRKNNLSNNTEKGILNINEVLVIPDTDGDLEQYFLNLKPYIEEEKVKTAIEVLYLSLEEAFFLSYACNCLQIFDLSSNILQSRDLWVLFQESQPDFIEKYVAYHYFRAKGWVVKTGTKFGGDFLLYKKGPLYFHASYIVIVEVLKDDKNSRSKMTWQKIVGMNRMAESATKEILICHVLWPNVEKEKFNDPTILKEFGVSETLLRRWLATQEKTPEMQNQ